MVFMYVLGFAPATIYQRFGRVGMNAFFLGGVVLSGLWSFASAHWNWWGAMGRWLGEQTAVSLATWTLPVIALGFLVSYGLLRKATV